MKTYECWQIRDSLVDGEMARDESDRVQFDAKSHRSAKIKAGKLFPVDYGTWSETTLLVGEQEDRLICWQKSDPSSYSYTSQRTYLVEVQ